MDILRKRNKLAVLREQQDRWSPKLVCSVSHSLPGRLRVRIPLFQNSPELMACERLFLSRIEGVAKTTSNAWCGSITIEYDPRKIKRGKLLELMQSVSVGEIVGLCERVGKHRAHKYLRTSVPLKWATTVLAAVVALAGAGSIARLLLYVLVIFISIPTYKRAFQCIFQERRFEFDTLNGLAITIGLLAGDLVTTAVMIWLICVGNYVNDVIASASDSLIQRLLALADEQQEEGSDSIYQRRFRIVAGVTTLAVGIVMVPLPGPGIVIIPLGLGMLASEFPWAAKWEEWLNSKMEAVGREAPLLAATPDRAAILSSSA